MPSISPSLVGAFRALRHRSATAVKKFGSRIDLKFTFVLGFCILGGFDACTSVAFRTEANNFTSAYRDVLNEQMLLNLARLDNGHPPYFIAVGTLTSRWKMGGLVEGAINPNDQNILKRTTMRASPTPT